MVVDGKDVISFIKVLAPSTIFFKRAYVSNLLEVCFELIEFALTLLVEIFHLLP